MVFSGITDTTRWNTSRPQYKRTFCKPDSLSTEENSNSFQRRRAYFWVSPSTRDRCFSVPAQKLEKLMHSLYAFHTRRFATPKEISRIAGQIISMGMAIGPLTRLFTRHMYQFIESRHSWSQRKTVDDDTHRELQFWHDNIRIRNGFGIKKHHLTTKVIYSDASADGFGGYIVQRLDKVIAQGKFSNIEKDLSSTHHELLAVLYTILSFHNLLRNESIQWYSDNSNACRIIAVGSPKRDLQQLALNIFELCLNNNISIHPVWVPREGNKFADYLSKYTDTDNWSIDDVTFQYIQRTLGLCTIDRFADGNNSKLGRFNSKFYCPHSECVP